MSGFRIITLAPEDWPRYKAIRLEALREAPAAFTTTYAEMLTRPDDFWRGRLEDAQRAETNWLVFAETVDAKPSGAEVRAGGQIVGLTGGFAEPAGAASTPAGVVHIVSVFVTPAARGQGIAAALLNAVMDAARQRGGFHTARLGVNAQQAAALALYRRMGFQVVAETTGLDGTGQTFQEYIMQRSLIPPRPLE